MAFEDFSDEKKEHYYDGEPHSFNNMWLGAVIFFILPLATLIGILLASKLFIFTTVERLFTFLWRCNHPSYTFTFVMSVMPNLIAFFWVYKSERWKLGKGLTIATLVYFCLFFVRQLG